jgi:hypothetical protein
METFTIDLGRGWWFRVWGSNKLVRRSDRLEAVVLALAIVVTVIAAPIAGAIGTSVHDARARLYAEQAQDRHQVTATAIDDSDLVGRPNAVSFVVRAKWNAAGRDHTGVVPWPDQAKPGEQQAIWVNAQGGLVAPPSPPSRAGSDALGVGLALWFGVAAAAAGLVAAVRRRLDHWRYVQWDREITELCDNDDRRHHQ